MVIRELIDKVQNLLTIDPLRFKCRGLCTESTSFHFLHVEFPCLNLDFFRSRQYIYFGNRGGINFKDHQICVSVSTGMFYL